VPAPWVAPGQEEHLFGSVCAVQALNPCVTVGTLIKQQPLWDPLNKTFYGKWVRVGVRVRLTLTHCGTH
jgi:hypothetical protein